MGPIPEYSSALLHGTDKSLKPNHSLVLYVLMFGCPTRGLSYFGNPSSGLICSSGSATFLRTI